MAYGIQEVLQYILLIFLLMGRRIIMHNIFQNTN